VEQELWSRMDLKNPNSTGNRTCQLPQRSGQDLTIEQPSVLRFEAAARREA
jgi:hypothetical protein